MKNASRPPTSPSRIQLHPLGTSSCLLALALAAAGPVHAVDVYWDTNGATAGASSGTTANGTWDAATTGNWTTSPTGVLPTSSYFIATGSSPSTADVIFAAGSNVTASSTITIHSQGTLTGVTANSLRIKDGAFVSATSGSFTSGPVLTLGAGGLRIDATTTGASSFNSNTSVGLAASQQWNNDSSFLFTAGGPISSVASALTTLSFSGTGSGGTTLTGLISNGATGTTALNVNTTGGGITTISNSGNTFSGGVTLTQGILRVQQGGASGTSFGTGGVTLAGGELRVLRTNANGTTFTGANTTLTGNSLIVSEVGTGTVGVNHTFGTLTAGAHTLSVAPGSMITSGTAGIIFGATTLTGAATFDVQSGAQLTLGALSGASSFNKQGVGTLLLNTAAASFSDGLNILEGTVNLANVTALGTGAGTINLGANNGSASATLEFGTAFGTYSANPIFVQSGAGSRNILTSGGTSGTAKKTIAGAIMLANDLTVTNVATHSGNSGVDFTGGFSGTGNLILDNSPATSGIVLSLATNEINHVGGIANVGFGTTQISSVIGSNVTQISNTGPGTLVLGGSNAFLGNVSVSSGTLRVANNNALSSANTLAVGAAGTLDLKQLSSVSYDQTIAGLNNNSGTGGTVTNSGGTVRTLTLAGNGNHSFAGSITGTAIALVKSGSGTQVLSGINTFTGNTTVSAGTLLIEGSLASTAVSVTGGTLGGSGSIGGAVSIGSGGTLSPGSSPGTITVASLSMLNGSNLAFEGGDLVSVTGQLDLDDNWTLVLGPGFADGGSVVLFTFGSLAASPDLLPTINIDNLGFTPSGPLSVTLLGNTVVLNGVSAIPEPSTALLAGVGLTLVLVRARRARRI